MKNLILVLAIVFSGTLTQAQTTNEFVRQYDLTEKYDTVNLKWDNLATDAKTIIYFNNDGNKPVIKMIVQGKDILVYPESALFENIDSTQIVMATTSIDEKVNIYFNDKNGIFLISDGEAGATRYIDSIKYNQGNIQNTINP